MVDKIKNALDKGVASVSVKSSVFVENTKISTQINNIQNNIQSGKNDLAEIVYLRWKEGVPFQSDAEAICASIAGYEEQIEQLKGRMEQMKRDSKQILGEKTEVGYCANCGTSNGGTAKFCFKCGARLA